MAEIAWIFQIPPDMDREYFVAVTRGLRNAWRTLRRAWAVRRYKRGITEQLKRTAGCVGGFVLFSLILLTACVSGKEDPAWVIWDTRTEVVAGGGYRGPWRMNESEFHYVDDPTVDVSPDGTVGVAWVDQSRKDIFFQSYTPDGKERFGEPVNVSRSPDVFSWFPKVVLTPEEPRHVYILWQEIVFSGGTHGGEIFFARSTDDGTTFEDTINLSHSIAGDGKGRLTPDRWDNGSLDLITGEDGTLYAAWTEYEGTLWFTYSTDEGERFSEPQRIAGGIEANPVRGPSLAATADTVYVAWTVGDVRNANIHVRKSSDRGRSFGISQRISESDGHSDAPKIAVDSTGTVHVVYGESPSGPMQRYHIRYTQLKNGEDAFDRPKDISKAQTTAFASVNFPSLRVDGNDNLYVLWELFPGQGWRPQGLGTTYSGDGGRTFAAPSIVPGSVEPALGVNGSQQGLLMEKLAVNTTGTIAAVNSTYKRNQESRIWLFRGQATSP